MANLRQTPLTCSGHTRPVVHLAFSDITESGYYLISACKGNSFPIRLRRGGTRRRFVWVNHFCFSFLFRLRSTRSVLDRLGLVSSKTKVSQVTVFEVRHCTLAMIQDFPDEFFPCFLRNKFMDHFFLMYALA